MDRRNTPAKYLVRNRVAGLIAIALTLSACGNGDGDGGHAADRVGPVHVVAALPPYASLAALIGGDSVMTSSLRNPGDTTHGTWKPSEGDYDALEKAELILVLGRAFDGWLAFSSLPESSVIHLAAAIEGEEVMVEGDAPHRHGMGSTHTHYVMDPHVWFDARLLTRQAAAIADALSDRRPQEAEVFRGRLEGLRGRLQSVHKTLESIPWKPNAVILSTHPSFRYLARRYGWTVTFLSDNVDARKRQLRDPNVAVVITSSPDAVIHVDGVPRVALPSMPTSNNGSIVDYLESFAEALAKAASGT